MAFTFMKFQYNRETGIYQIIILTNVWLLNLRKYSESNEYTIVVWQHTTKEPVLDWWGREEREGGDGERKKKKVEGEQKWESEAIVSLEVCNGEGAGK